MPRNILIHTCQRRMCSFVGYWLAHRYGFLFYALLITLIAFPLLVSWGLDQTLLFAFVSVSLAVALVGMRSRPISHLLLVLLVVLLAVRSVAGSLDLHNVIAISTVALALLGFVAGIDTVRVAMNASRVDVELLYAALSVYMLTGVLFAVLHFSVALAAHDAYSLPEGEPLSLHTAMYFSFSTQTTLGYGDILPRGNLARGLAMVQAIAGQLYLSVMVARLVGLYVSSAGRNTEAR